MNNDSTLRGLVHLLSAGVATPHQVCLSMGDCRFRVMTNSGNLARELTRYFAPFLNSGSEADISITALQGEVPDLGLIFEVKEPDPGKTKIKEEWADIEGGRVIRKRLTGMHFLFGNGENLAVGDCEANPNQVVNFINNRFIERKLNEDCLLAHAAGVAMCETGMAMAGFSGMGKSTLALHLVSKGVTFVSNDRLMISPASSGPVMFGVAKHPRINPGTALHNPDLTGIISPEDTAHFQSLPPEELWSLEHKYDALIDQLFGPDRFILQCPMRYLVLLNWHRDGSPTRFEEIDINARHDLLEAFMKDTGLFFTAENGYAPTQDDYAKALAGCRVFEISGGVDFDQAADGCLRLLEKA
ncbi:HprK-related kinase B [Desulfomicrobium norvegicum]|uniref:HprK-related kinase B n=1 Tax=Desulfomicrobium norvegicum (strain DSM 1741 / NCIMB 8310) TaxID=52561 RepID=A0A8G2FDU9_DESNO|nr:HprK-related kinase B [Desulfomicrobium norvegicum]SFL56411.1 HprK-related kinase B [Desulfomicrobium norvegicum]